jgi:hypothetical protein
MAFFENELMFCGLNSTYRCGLNQYSEAHLLYRNFAMKFYFCFSKYCMLLNLYILNLDALYMWALNGGL